MIAGEQNIDELLKLRHGRIQSSIEDMVSALKGNLTAHHKFMLQTIKESMAGKQNLIAKLDSQIEAYLKSMS